jgi:hypothetical protein
MLRAADASADRCPLPIGHQELTEDEFLARFKPIPNPLNEAAGFDFGEGGCLFEAVDSDLEFVRAQPLKNVWTIIEGDEGIEITDGIHFVNRFGYLVTCPR